MVHRDLSLTRVQYFTIVKDIYIYIYIQNILVYDYHRIQRFDGCWIPILVAMQAKLNNIYLVE